MDERDCDGPFANCRCDPLDITAAHVAHRKHAGQTGFEQMWRPGGRPMGGGQIVLGQIRSRLNESFRLECDAAPQPVRARYRAGHDKDMAELVGLDAADLIVAPAHAFEMITAFEGDDFAVGSEDNGRVSSMRRIR